MVSLIYTILLSKKKQHDDAKRVEIALTSFDPNTNALEKILLDTFFTIFNHYNLQVSNLKLLGFIHISFVIYASFIMAAIIFGVNDLKEKVKNVAN